MQKIFYKNVVKILKKFQQIIKILLRKLLKMDFWSYFSKNLTNPAFNFCAFGRKTLFAGNFEKIMENILKKIAKNELF